MKKYRLYTIITVILFNTACTKDFLDKRPDQTLAVPTQLDELQALLDNILIFSQNNIGVTEVGAADFYISDADYLAISSPSQRNAYNWQKDIWGGATAVNEWNSNYEKIFYANVALEGLEKLAETPSNKTAYGQAKGMALFLRSYSFYQLLQMFAPTYGDDAAQALGIPLRLNANINEISKRATVQESYQQIITDLNAALSLLPIQVTNTFRPAQLTAHAVLARVYLVMGDYENALKHANSCIALSSGLLDYNQLNATASFPVPNLNKEVLYYNSTIRITIWEAGKGKIVKELYDSYEDNDLRKKVFFGRNSDGTYSFKGSYLGSRTLFFGIAIDEQYLIRAECYARLEQYDLANKDLNTLLKARYATGSFTDLNISTKTLLLKRIFAERRKELLLRGLRWTDLRRLNKEPEFAVTLKRELAGISYQLAPNDAKYVLPIPDYILAITGMPQNQRN